MFISANVFKHKHVCVYVIKPPLYQGLPFRPAQALGMSSFLQDSKVVKVG